MNLDAAIMIASQKHFTQRDKSDMPYILHPLIIMFRLRNYGYNEDFQIVAVLHDIIEDTDTTIEYLEQYCFQPHVIDAIIAITKVEGETYNEYVERCIKNDIARIVKYFDSAHNRERKTDDENFNKFLEKRYGRTMERIIEYCGKAGLSPQPG